MLASHLQDLYISEVAQQNSTNSTAQAGNGGSCKVQTATLTEATL